MKLNKKMIIPIGIIAMVVVFLILMYTGILETPTTLEGEKKNTDISVSDASELKDDHFYVYHDGEFFLCPEGDKNWKKNNTTYAHALWFTSDNDMNIPTLYSGDKLVYVSSEKIPYDGIEWEHYADYGYSIGVVNMVKDKSGHYRIENENGDSSSSKDGFLAFLYDKSDASVLSKYASTSIFLNKLGDVEVRENNVSDCGVIANLEKNATYVCEWYTGTYYQDYEMTANIHPFVAFETFKTYDYEFLHSNCISITIPSWFTTGYYYVQDLGLFRYVSEEDAAAYDGEPYDASIDWNQTVIEYDENGKVIYDPTSEYNDTSTSTITDSDSDRDDIEDDEAESIEYGTEYEDYYSDEVVDGTDEGKTLEEEDTNVTIIP